MRKSCTSQSSYSCRTLNSLYQILPKSHSRSQSYQYYGFHKFQLLNHSNVIWISLYQSNMRISPTSRVGLKHSKVKKACDSPFFLLNHSKVKPQVSILSHVGLSSLLPSHSEVTGPQKYWSLSFSTVRTVQITSQQKSTYTHMHACVHMHTPLHNHMHVYTHAHTHTHTHTHTEDWKGFSLKAVYMDREDFLKDIPIVHVREEWTFLCTVYKHTHACVCTHMLTHTHTFTHTRGLEGLEGCAVYMDREVFLKDIQIVHLTEEWTFLLTADICMLPTHSLRVSITRFSWRTFQLSKIEKHEHFCAQYESEESASAGWTTLSMGIHTLKSPDTGLRLTRLFSRVLILTPVSLSSNFSPAPSACPLF